MESQEKSLKIIEALEYNAQRVSEIINVSRKVVSDKMRNVKYNKFTKEQEEILTEYARKKIIELNEIINY